MLPRQYRLKNKSAFNATYKQKNVIANNFFVAYLGREKKDTSLPTRFGFVVSKKFHKRAVKRNRIKRLMREAVRLFLKKDGAKSFEKYQSLIIIPKQRALNPKFSDVVFFMENIFEKL
ncbi:MAG: ribonuclease P protein component [Candidatus Gastranaerophilales bacterium]|nr:ribonuclease P protein component [Candidatus Gastranaerophilales bacterium]